MAPKPIVLLPDPVLARPATAVAVLDDAARSLARDLVDTMRAAGHSVGVAAPQIGVGVRAFVVDVTGHPRAQSCHGEFVLFNPELLVVEGRDVARAVAREGCMSVPDLTGDVARATQIVVQGVDPDGNGRVLECDAFEARAVQHELDHLDGRLFLDRVVSRDLLFPRRVYR
ncbi:MAG: peptide deformylase [Acidimicrobiales bacterium]